MNRHGLAWTIAMQRRILALVAMVLVLNSCSSGGGGGYDAGGGYGAGPAVDPTPGLDEVVATSALSFNPATLNTTAGHTVNFVFASVAHNVFFDAKTGAPADISGSNVNTSVTRVFATAGSYTFSCHIHPTMRGTVIVQ